MVTANLFIWSTMCRDGQCERTPSVSVVECCPDDCKLALDSSVAWMEVLIFKDPPDSPVHLYSSWGGLLELKSAYCLLRTDGLVRIYCLHEPSVFFEFPCACMSMFSTFAVSVHEKRTEMVCNLICTYSLIGVLSF